MTASLALIERAAALQADTLLVHHGLFWRGQDGRVVAWLKTRVERVIAAGTSLYAYRLPLDPHSELGNNAQFRARLGSLADARCSEPGLGSVATAGGGAHRVTERYRALTAAAGVVARLGLEHVFVDIEKPA